MQSMLRHQEPVYNVPINGKWVSITEKTLLRLARERDPAYWHWDAYIQFYQKNPLACFLAHGRKRRDKQKNDGLAFINDWENDMQLLRAPGKVGKTFIGAAKAGIFAGPCNPEWPCFTQHGVQYREWQGKTEGILSSFSWDNVAILWKTYCKLWPREWLGPYAPNYGMFPEEKGKPQTKVFGDGRPKTVELPCGITLTMLCDTQSIVHWESRMADWAHADEQLSEDKVDVLLTRFQTSAYKYNPVWFTLTPFIVDERPDTGAAGWLKRKVIDGGATKGRKFKEYVIDMACVPDVIVSKKKKKESYQRNIVEPEKLHDAKKQREGRARYHAEWEVGGGLVISAWDPDIHMIEPFDMKKFRPTFFRMIDHGENPCAALLIAVMPWGDAVCFAEYYEFGNSIGMNVQHIVENLCGNKRQRVDEYMLQGQTWPVFEEICIKHNFLASEMDSRSFASNLRESGRTLGRAYNEYGCKVSPASGQQGHREDKRGLVDLMCQFFELEKGRKHINSRLGREVPEKTLEFGSPRVYIFSSLKHFRNELEGWSRNPKTGRPFEGKDHLIDCFKYFSARERPYIVDEINDERNTEPMQRSSITGY